MKYLQAAFANHWNLLALAAGIGVAVIGQSYDVVLPLVLAAEIGYLTLLGTHPKFQRHVDAQQHRMQRDAHTQRNRATLQHILKSLPRPLLDRYTQLRTRCLELQRIADDLKRPVALAQDEPLASMQAESLDRLLWIYLRLLFTYHSLERFLEKTPRMRIQADIDRLQRRLAELDKPEDSPHAQKIRRALEDNLATSQDRLRNYDRAQANHEFVELEIDRLENKIKSLAEVAVNRQEPEYVSSQVDQVARSMLETERTMNELQVFTGLTDVDEQVPMLLEVNEQRSR